MSPDLTEQRLTEQLIEVANHYGADPEYSRAGGGNASAKIDGVLHIKPSGVPLATLTAGDLVPLRIDVLLDALVSDEEGEGDPVRAAAARALVRDTGRRPSVEILFHALIPDALVLHTHPLVANALTCNAEAERLATELLGDDAVLVDYIDPGVPLARGVAAAREAYTARTGRPAPGITLLRNHGIIVSGDTAAQIHERSERVTGAIRAAIDAVPEPVAPALDEDRLARVRSAVAPTLRGLLGDDRALPVVTSDAGDLVRGVTLTPAGDAILSGGPLIPDQIVYAGSLPAVLRLDDPADPTDPAAAATAAVEEFRARYGKDPVIVVVPGLVAFGVGKDLASARTALRTFTDALRVARDAERIGTVRVMSAVERGFIENWEAEAYRKSVAASQASGRLDGKVVMVTGAAQGFGLGIAQQLVAQGASLVLADLNLAGAEAQAAEMCAEHGAGRAVAVRIDVSDEHSCLAAVAETVGVFGGVDVFISNAGVLRAESVFTQPVA
ncbi:MAG TPA: SDR family NAD(P)-dependent oxidoreductase, partial [Arachnia sp.]|nr:SDR family NAD(P)-dependent oxidoreductase [Arachnia sp.]